MIGNERGALMIAVERLRQIDELGWSAEHDDEHENNGQLIAAAMCYARHVWLHDGPDADPDITWPWYSEDDGAEFIEWWHPSADPVRNLVKAGALIAAEIDRLERARA
jgi:hypothetical protein